MFIKFSACRLLLNARKFACGTIKPHYKSKTTSSLGMLLSPPVKVLFLPLCMSDLDCKLDNSKAYE